MKKIHTLLLIAAIVAFGAIFAGLNLPTSPPTRAEKAEAVKTFETKSVQTNITSGASLSCRLCYSETAFGQTNFHSAVTGDISISTVNKTAKTERSADSIQSAGPNRRMQIKALLQVIKEVKRDRPTHHDSNKFVSDFAVFRGFGEENRSRAKI